MTYTWQEDGRWEYLSLVKIYNGIKFVFDFDVASYLTSKI